LIGTKQTATDGPEALTTMYKHYGRPGSPAIDGSCIAELISFSFISVSDNEVQR